MAQYIDKSALVVEIKRRIADNKKDIERASHKNLEDYFEGYEDALALLKQQFLDTLEVKEVDLDKEIKEEYLKHRRYGGRDDMLVILNEPQFNNIAKHFFELGMSVSNKTQKREKV